ncbi:MAG: hypothetical protein DI535_10870 [Citrobacter freundii]|nr:MAG: hypothetical protein DI535_10870 [Citrobacter freundii]
MQKSNGRLREENSNGSVVNVKVNNGAIFITLKHDNRVWKGELIMQGSDLGVVAYKYTDCHEYGKRECVLGNFSEYDSKFDFIFLTPINDTIYYLEPSGENMIANYNYGREILIRPRSK